MSNYVPNTKVMAGGLGGTISALIIDVLQGRFGLVLSDGELQFIIVFSGVIIAYFTPEPARTDV